MKFNTLVLPVTFILLCLLVSCGGSSDKVVIENTEEVSTVIIPPSSGKMPVPNNQAGTDYHVLMIGNSHTNSVKDLLAILLEQSSNNVKVQGLFGTFLDVALVKEGYIETLTEQSWTHVVLQGQKYSQSGAKLYPTAAARQWISTAKEQDVMPVLFPEHPQKGNTFEGNYVHGIHVNIANEEPSCVAPVGLAWDLALGINGALDLYTLDGNHASELGALYSALVIYQVITGQSADLLPYISTLPGDADVQDFLGQMASQAIAENTPCVF